MRIEAYYIIAVMFAITFIATLTCESIRHAIKHKKTNTLDALCFDEDDYYPKRNNVPFLQDKNIMDVIDAGSQLVGNNLFVSQTKISVSKNARD